MAADVAAASRHSRDRARRTHTTLSIGWVGVRLGIAVRSDQSGSGCTQVGIRRQVIITLKQFVPSTQITLAQ